MRTVKKEITLRDIATGETLVIAPLSATRVKALIRAYSLAGIDAVAL